MNSIINQKLNILFLCTCNSARSIMAEALVNHYYKDNFMAVSAGTHPEGVDDRTLIALKKYNLPITQLKSQTIEEYNDHTFDYVITLCDKANQECRNFPGAAKQLSWDLTDPKTRSGLDPFVSTLIDLKERLSLFVTLEVKAQTVNNDLSNISSREPINPLKVDPSAFFKCLTDDIRLKVLLLSHYFGELCVCELMEALQENSQPKVSRNLAVLKKAGIINDRKNGQWVFYRINPELPLWIKTVIGQTAENNVALIAQHSERLTKMKNRPNKESFCQ